MQRLPKHKTRRRGAIAPLTAILLIPLLAMVAFSVDLAYLVMVQTDLQNAADASALAGTQELIVPYVRWSLPGQTSAAQQAIRSNAISAAQQAAKDYASANVAGGVNITLLDSDIEVGYTDSQGNYNPNPPQSTFPNTVHVTVRRDKTANTSVSMFFAPVLGTRSVDLSASAKAAAYEGEINTLKSIQGVDAHILPVALDINVWKTFYNTGKSPDGQVHYAPNGYPELQVYPTDPNTPGSFGLVDTGQPSNDAPAFRAWIEYGDTPNDINYLLNNNLLPVSLDAPQPWKVGPGLKDTLKDNFQDQAGKPNLIPVFVPYQQNPYVAAQGQGQGATYNIVGFVGVDITEVTANGNNLNISIQPTGAIDPTGVITAYRPLGTGTSVIGGSSTTFTAPKLIQ
jgi:Flp pilus assembly protein TadG